MTSNLFSTILTSTFFIYSLSSSCPHYQCVDGESQYCVSLTSGIETIGYNSVNLTDICQAGEICDVHPPAYYFLATMTKNANITCNQHPTNFFRYAGEDCAKDDDCFRNRIDKLLGKCIANKCSGHDENDQCFDDLSCLKGLYCDSYTNTCQEQKPWNADCTSSYECTNSLLCHEQRCILSPFSLPLNSTYMQSDTLWPLFKCVMGFSDNNICSTFNQTDTSQIYIPCEMNQLCNYTINGIGNLQNRCDCGYNTEGQGYCQSGQDTSI
jgi:hypothetical protein